VVPDPVFLTTPVTATKWRHPADGGDASGAAELGQI
jgi:hypothetical protein